REARHGRAHGDVLAGLGRHFFGEHLLEEVGIGKLFGRRLLQQRLQSLPALEQAQLEQVLAETFELGRIHATSASCSYTARSRTSTSRQPCAGAAAAGALKRVRVLRAVAPGPWAGSTCS